MKKVAKIFRGAAYTLFRLELIIAFLCEIILIDLCEHPSAWQLISQDTILYSIMQVASVCLVVVETIIIAKMTGRTGWQQDRRRVRTLHLALFSVMSSKT